jgi:hypothetical protein
MFLKFLSYLQDYYYCAALMIAASIAALVVSLKYYGRHGKLHLFTWYILLSLFQVATDYFRIAGNNVGIPRLVAGITGNVFMLYEFILCIYFILLHVSSVTRRRIIKVDAGIYLSFVVFCFCRNYRFIINAVFFFFESLFLVLPCLIYFYELFLGISDRSLKNQPDFWIITGILFLNSCAVPLFLTLGGLGKYEHAAFSLNYILYAIFFLLLIRAYLCRPAEPPLPADGQFKTG